MHGKDGLIETEQLSAELRAIVSALPSRYEFSNVIGRGGMGLVIKAQDLELKRQVAIKLLSIPGLEAEEALQRFSREAKALASLDHANIVKLLSWGISKSGQPFQVMEYLEGESLSSFLKEKGKLGPLTFTQIFVQVLDGLKHAHQEQIVHRDLKPSNIIIARTANEQFAVKLIDFGIARVLDNNDNVQLTKSYAVLGSPPYMSPEQCQGQAADYRSDIYSLGCIMYEALSGTTPFNCESAMEQMYAHVNSDFKHLEDAAILPEAHRLGKLIDSCLSKDPANRPASVSDVLLELEEILRLQTDSRKLFAESGKLKKNSYIPLALLVLLILASLYLLFNKQSKKSESTNILNKNQERINRLIVVEKNKLKRLEESFRREKDKERQKDLAQTIIDQGKKLVVAQNQAGLAKESEKNLQDLLPYCQIMDNPDITKAVLYHRIAVCQLDQQRFKDTIRSCDLSLLLLAKKGYSMSEDSILNLFLKIRAFTHMQEFSLAEIEFCRLKTLWNTISPPKLPENLRQRTPAKFHSKTFKEKQISSGECLANELMQKEKSTRPAQRLAMLKYANTLAEFLEEGDRAKTAKLIEFNKSVLAKLPESAEKSEEARRLNELIGRLKEKSP